VESSHVLSTNSSVPRGSGRIENLAQIPQIISVLTKDHVMQHHPSVTSSAHPQLLTPLRLGTKLCHPFQHHHVDALLQLHARRCTSADGRSLQITTRCRAKTPRTIHVASDPCGKRLPPIQSRHPPRIPRMTSITITLSNRHAQFRWPTTETPINIHPPNYAKLFQSTSITTCWRHLPSIQSIRPSANRINTYTSNISSIAEG